jgi:hypothetical protein
LQPCIIHRAPTCDVPRLATDEGDVSGGQHATCDATSDSQRTTYSVQHATCRTQLAMHSLRLEAGMVHRARTGQPQTCCNSVQCVAALPNVERQLYPRRPRPTLTQCSEPYCAATCCAALRHGALGCTTPERPAAALPTPAPADPHAFGTPPYPRYAPHDAGLCSTTARTALSQPAAHALSDAELCARNG